MSFSKYILYWNCLYLRIELPLIDQNSKYNSDNNNNSGWLKLRWHIYEIWHQANKEICGWVAEDL